MLSKEEQLIADRAIPKKDLIHGVWYKGRCRNAPVAIWDEKKEVFRYIRFKFVDFFSETINHFEDDNGYDLFFPFERI